METAHSGKERKTKTGKRTEFYTPQLTFNTDGFGRRGSFG
jgi:hypothetical protein